MVRIKRGERVAHYETVRLTKEGLRLHVSLAVSPVRDFRGEIVGASIIARDMTERRRAEEELKAANTELERLSRLKDEFLSMASHELKTPITSLRLFAELVARRPGKMQREAGETLLRQTAQLTRLVSDLLDVSRLQLGRMPVEKRPLDLVKLVGAVCEQWQATLLGKHLECSFGAGKTTVEADPVRLEQVLTNPLDNAAKYSPNGGPIEVRLERRDGKALLVVHDEGVGIAPEHLPHVFERFYKPGPQQAVYSGLGVGLYICKELVERHGSRIWAESEPGHGSTFYVELPLASQPATETEDTAPS